MTKCTIRSCWRRGGEFSNICPFDSASLCDQSLLVFSIDLARDLAYAGRVSFRSHGTCMYPCIRPGDLLTIEPRAFEEIKVGAIIVFRRGNTLFSHRAIFKSTADEAPYLITKPDRAVDNTDGPIPIDDILGIVVSIQRGGMDQPLDPQPLRGLSALQATSVELRENHLFPLLDATLSWCQQRSWYRFLSMFGFDCYCRDRRYMVKVPLSPGQMHDLYRRIPAEEFDPNRLLWKGAPPARWILEIFLRDDKVPVCSCTVVQYPDDCPRGSGWWIEGMSIRMRYRGIGLEEILSREAGRILIKAGMILQGSADSRKVDEYNFHNGLSYQFDDL